MPIFDYYYFCLMWVLDYSYLIALYQRFDTDASFLLIHDAALRAAMRR